MAMRFLTLLFSVLLAGALAAQVPQAFDFQAVARDASGNVLSARPVSVRLTVHTATANGPVAYGETHAATTNAFGLFHVAVGQGSAVQGVFSALNWGSGSHFLQVELDANGGSDYVDMGTTQLLSVPYALHAGGIDCPTVSLLGDTLKQANGCYVIIPGISAANGGCADADNDGFYNNPACPPLDCNDINASIHPGAAEVCGNGMDDDCDGSVDENCSGCTDNDADGYTTCQGDCNDNNASVNPGATELCGNGLDDDCDEQADEGCGNCVDNDGDGFTTCDGDCDDTNSSVHPGATEICGDGLDNDCDGQTDEGCGPQELCNGIDDDGDGQVDEGFNIGQPCGCGGVWECDGSGGATCSLPVPPEICGDGIDNDCDGQTDEGCVNCTDNDADGYTTCQGDCNDNNAAVNPGAAELCGNGLDDDCDAQADEGCGNCVDSDGDGFTTCDGDCDDTNTSVHPGATEICGDGLDNDCDGLTDDPSECP